MNNDYKEKIVRRPKLMFGESRKYFYSENPRFPKFRILMNHDEVNDASMFWNACIEFTNAFQYHELTWPQRVLKMLVSFYGFAHNAGVGHGMRLLIDNDALWPQKTVLTHGDLHPGHILINAQTQAAGFIDWAEAAVADPATDFVGHYWTFGAAALDKLVTAYQNAGGNV